MFSGISDEDDHVRLGGYPGAFRDLLGVRVEEFFPLLEGEVVDLEGGGRAEVWSEDVTAVDATVVDRYSSGPLTGRPAVTRRDVGAGSAWYLSTLPDDTTLDALLGRLVEEAGITPVAAVPPGVEAVRRRGPGGSWLFLVNDTDTAQRVPARGHDLVTDLVVDAEIALEPGRVAVLRER